MDEDKLFALHTLLSDACDFFWWDELRENPEPGFWVLLVDDKTLRRTLRKNVKMRTRRYSEADAPDCIKDKIATHVVVGVPCASEMGEMMYRMLPRGWRDRYGSREKFVEADRENRVQLSSSADRLVNKLCQGCAAVTSIRCSRCNVVNYCSMRCQQQDFKRHRPFCDLVFKAQEKIGLAGMNL